MFTVTLRNIITGETHELITDIEPRRAELFGWQILTYELTEPSRRTRIAPDFDSFRIAVPR